jgi:hypothetical protein
MQRGVGCQPFDLVGSDPKPVIGVVELLGTTSGADPEFHAAIMLEPASSAKDVSVTFFVAAAVSSDNDRAPSEHEVTASPGLAGGSALTWLSSTRLVPGFSIPGSTEAQRLCAQRFL